MARHTKSLLTSVALIAFAASAPSFGQSARDPGTIFGDTDTAVPLYDGAFDAGSGSGDNLGNHVASMDLDMNNRRIIRTADPDMSSAGGYDVTNRRYVDAIAKAEAENAKDNLGNHTAERNLNMANYYVVNVRTPTGDAHAANKAYVDAAAAAARDNLGDHTATTNLSMAGNSIIGLAEPTANSHATNKEYVDDRVNAAKDNMGDHSARRDVEMNGFVITGLADPTGALQAANKRYVDGAASDAAESAKDNLGNHNATMRLNMAGNSIVNVPAPSSNTHAANKQYVDGRVNDRALKTVQVNAGYGLTGGGSLGTSRTLSIEGDHRRRAAGNSQKGVMAYNGNSRALGQFYGGSQNPTQNRRLNYNGYLHASRFYAQMYLYFSDRNLKEKIETIGADQGMGIVRDLRPVSYEWKESGRPALGVIAQEIEEVMPMAVSTGEDGLKSVDYVQMIAPMLAAIQQLDERVARLEASP